MKRTTGLCVLTTHLFMFEMTYGSVTVTFEVYGTVTVATTDVVTVPCAVPSSGSGRDSLPLPLCTTFSDAIANINCQA